VIGFGIFAIVVALALFTAIAIPVGIVWLLISLIRAVAGGPRRDRYDPAAEQLRMRFARGEISQADYENGMRSLGYERRP
jgi:uncharacterized membrane protein